MQKNSELISKNMSKLSAIAMVFMLCSLFMPAISTAASSVTFNGINDGSGEYQGGTSNGVESLLWYNNHNSIYTEAANNKNDLLWEINDNSTDGWSVNIFVEVPLYARRMIWIGSGDKKDPGDKDDNNNTGSSTPSCKHSTAGAIESGCELLAPSGNTDYLDAYLEGSHHNDGVKMNYSTQTGSEYFWLESVDEIDKIGWEVDEQDANGLTDGFSWKTSREYLFEAGICDEDKCLEFNRSASLELMWTGLTDASVALKKVTDIFQMELHLSDEAVGLPAVPVPAAFWLFGTALIGFIGISRRTNLS